MKMRETYKVNLTTGKTFFIYCKRDEILDNITGRDFVNLVSVEVFNRSCDKVNHRPILKEQLA